jgi:hypothetical protein
MGRGTVGIEGLIASFAKEPQVGSDPPALVPDLNSRGSTTGLYVFMDETVRNRVVVVVHLDMVIDMDLVRTPFSVLIASGRKGPHCRQVHLLKQVLSGYVQLLELPGIEFLKYLSDRPVEFGETKEALVS